MESTILTPLLLILPLIILFFFAKNKRSSKNLPPGSLGIPIIGQSLDLVRAMRANKGEEWFQQRVQKYGPISKLNLFGTPTVFLHGHAANKFIYTCSEKILANNQPSSIRRLCGERNLVEMTGKDHKRVRGAIVSFLKPEALKQSVSSIDKEIKLHFEKHWHGKHEIQVQALMKTLTFDVICSIIFGIERGARRNTLVKLFEHLLDGVLSVPINLPFTRFNKSLRARSKIRDIILELIQEKRQQAKQSEIPHSVDLISTLLNMCDEKTNSVPLLSIEEIVDSAILIMLAGFDTTSILLTFLIKLLAENSEVYENVLKEHEEIARGKASPNDSLTWEDLAKMKYTWRTATESLRMYPPVFFSFRKVVQDIQYGGYVIPSGWQVIWAGFMTQMDESIYPEPSKFDPSRFENQQGTPAYSFMAFGGGPRMCPGYEFARIETLTLIHYLVTGFQWKLLLRDNLFVRDPQPVFIKGLPIKIELKNST